MSEDGARIRLLHFAEPPHLYLRQRLSLRRFLLDCLLTLPYAVDLTHD